MSFAVQGVFCAAATPVLPGGTPNLPLFTSHCQALLAEGCHGIALLGTTGEANNFGVTDRMALLDAAIAAGVAPGALLPGTSTTSVADTVALTRHAVQAGARGTVMLPPFYYKAPSDEGLYRFYAQVIEGVADARLRLVLYHIPQVTQVPISHALIARLLAGFPGIVVGIKDSAGELSNMQAMIRDFPGFGVLAGADPLLLPVLQAGGAGCITASSNLVARELRLVWDNWQNPAQAEAVRAAQARIVVWRSLSSRYVLVPTVKAMLARRRGDPGWLALRPPLIELTETERADVWAEMARLEA